MGSTWGPPRSWRPRMGPILAPWTLPSGLASDDRALDTHLPPPPSWSLCQGTPNWWLEKSPNTSRINIFRTNSSSFKTCIDSFYRFQFTWYFGYQWKSFVLVMRPPFRQRGKSLGKKANAKIQCKQRFSHKTGLPHPIATKHTAWKIHLDPTKQNAYSGPHTHTEDFNVLQNLFLKDFNTAHQCMQLLYSL